VNDSPFIPTAKFNNAKPLTINLPQTPALRTNRLQHKLTYTIEPLKSVPVLEKRAFPLTFSLKTFQSRYEMPQNT